jgi:hypothetical protein
MGGLSRRGLIAAAVTATGIAMLPTLARAQTTGRGYRLLIEDGIDTISVRKLIAGHLGTPDTVGRIMKNVLGRTEELRTIAANMEGGRTIVVACPAVATALEALTRQGATRDRRMTAELNRVLPASALELLVFA